MWVTKKKEDYVGLSSSFFLRVRIEIINYWIEIGTASIHQFLNWNRNYIDLVLILILVLISILIEWDPWFNNRDQDYLVLSHSVAPLILQDESDRSPRSFIADPLLLQDLSDGAHSAPFSFSHSTHEHKGRFLTWPQPAVGSHAITNACAEPGALLFDR